MTYTPPPLDTSNMPLPEELAELADALARHTDELCAEESNPHPLLVPFDDLPEPEKVKLRQAAAETLKAMLALGYRILPPEGPTQAGTRGEDLQQMMDRLLDPAPMGLDQLLRLWKSNAGNISSLPPEPLRLLGERILKAGEPLMAYDLLSEAAESHPNDLRTRQLLALALARSGSVQRANTLLQELRDQGHRDGETLGILARTHKDLWALSQDPDEKERQLLKAHSIYREAFDLSLDGGFLDEAVYTGINAAATAFFLGGDDAVSLARTITRLCLDRLGQSPSYWALASLGEAALIEGDLDRAGEFYGEAAGLGRGRLADLSSTRRQARQILLKMGEDANALDRCFPMPSVAVFSGHMIDLPGRTPARFPPELERAVAGEMDLLLDRINAGIGYSSAACGSDILFLEAMLRRGAEINIVLPFSIEAFREISVEIYPGGGWGARFDKVLERAAQVIHAGESPSPSGAEDFDYANLVLDGLAVLRAGVLETALHPVAVWDEQPGDGAGGTASMVAQWRSRGLEPEVIRPRPVFFQEDGPAPTTPPQRPSAPEPCPREIRAMLFFDVVGYSRLSDEEIPPFVSLFMGEVARLLQSLGRPPLAENTWGDALYCVFEDVRDAGVFALDLRDHVCNVAWEGLGLPRELSLRISLHAGPVYLMEDPILKKPNYYGAHVSRAARIEPITPPGEVYASRPFAAISAARGIPDFTCEYVGRIPLPKKSGVIPLYLVRRAGEAVKAIS